MSGLTVKTTNLNPLEAGAAFVPAQVVTGGAVPYSAVVSAGALPDGVYLNPNDSTISGTPSTPGAYTFDVTVTDRLGASITQTYSGTISGIAVVVEDGSVVQGANAYINAAQADALLALEPNLDLTTWTPLTATQKAAYCIAASRWLDDRVLWTGQRKTDQQGRAVRLDAFPIMAPQPMAWPRRNAYDRDRRGVSETIVPGEIRRAAAMIAHYMLTQEGEDGDQAGIRRFRADTFEIEYQQGWFKSPAPPWLKFVLRGLGQLANETGFKKIVKV